jgi:hypothetical protein
MYGRDERRRGRKIPDLKWRVKLMDQMGSEDAKNGREEKYFKYFIRSLSRWRTLKCDSRLGRLLNDETAVGGGLKGKK